MKPNKPGIWEWFDNDGTKRLVEVYDVSTSLRKIYSNEPAYLRVYWWGGYYNVNDETDDTGYEWKAEWADRWGERIGDNGSLPEEQLYLGPTEEQRDKIFAKLNESIRQDPK